MTALGSKTATKSSPTPPRLMTRKRWVIIWLAFIGLSINYLDRSSLSVALPFMGKDFELTATQQGLIFAAFFWAYDFCQLAAGWYVDKVGPRRSFSLAAVWWSVFTMVTAAATNFWSLFAARFLLGVGESPAPSTAAKVVATWFPVRERAFATSIWDSGSRVGAVIALPIVTLIVALTSWHAVFIIIGVAGIIWAAVWWKVYRSPQEHPGANAAEVAYIEEGGARGEASDDANAAKLPWRSLFKYRTVLSMMFGFFCLNSAIYFFITFFPSYLVKERGFDLLKLGMFGAIPGHLRRTVRLARRLPGRPRRPGRGIRHQGPQDRHRRRPRRRLRHHVRRTGSRSMDGPRAAVPGVLQPHRCRHRHLVAAGRRRTQLTARGLHRRPAELRFQFGRHLHADPDRRAC